MPDHRHPKATISLSDALLSTFAPFSPKDPSLLVFDARRNDTNTKSPYGIGQIPSDTLLHEILDPVKPELLRPVFADVFRQLQRGRILKRFVFHPG